MTHDNQRPEQWWITAKRIFNSQIYNIAMGDTVSTDALPRYQPVLLEIAVSGTLFCKYIRLDESNIVPINGEFFTRPNDHEHNECKDCCEYCE